MTGQQKSAETQALRQDKRMDPNHRMRIDAAIHMQGRGWMTGRAGGRPWTLSRTKRVLSFIGALMIVMLISKNTTICI